MGHIKHLGECERCSLGVISVMDIKEHTVGEASKIDLIKYKEGQELSAA